MLGSLHGHAVTNFSTCRIRNQRVLSLVYFAVTAPQRHWLWTTITSMGCWLQDLVCRKAEWTSKTPRKRLGHVMASQSDTNTGIESAATTSSLSTACQRYQITKPRTRSTRRCDLAMVAIPLVPCDSGLSLWRKWSSQVQLV